MARKASSTQSNAPQEGARTRLHPVGLRGILPWAPLLVTVTALVSFPGGQHMLDVANMVAKPYQISETVREAVYLIRCDSTDTLLARGKTFWVHEKNLEQRPLGAPEAKYFF